MRKNIANGAVESAKDSMLVLLPGSRISQDGIAFLSELTKLDTYMVQIGLRVKLPRILCPCASDAINGATGDRLETLGIRFLAIKKSFLLQPFKPFLVSGCQLNGESGTFFRNGTDSVLVSKKDNVLLIESCYRSTRDERMSRLTDIKDAGADISRKKAVYARDLKSFKVIMLYRQMNPEPLCFIDHYLDFSFLGSSMKMTVPSNFQTFRDLLENTFGQKIDQTMIKYAFALKQVQTENKISKSGWRRRKESITTKSSNESEINRMAGLLFGQWCKENGWISRVMAF